MKNEAKVSQGKVGCNDTDAEVDTAANDADGADATDAAIITGPVATATVAAHDAPGALVDLATKNEALRRVFEASRRLARLRRQRANLVELGGMLEDLRRGRTGQVERDDESDTPSFGQPSTAIAML